MSTVRKPLILNKDTGLPEELPVNDVLDVNALDGFVPISLVDSANANGNKGQWSFGLATWNNAEYPAYWVCIARNTWLELPSNEKMQELLDLKLDNSTFENAFSDQFVPVANIANENSLGEKGQFSFGNGYYYACVAKDTWVRHLVEVSFTT